MVIFYVKMGSTELKKSKSGGINNSRRGRHEAHVMSDAVWSLDTAEATPRAERLLIHRYMDLRMTCYTEKQTKGYSFKLKMNTARATRTRIKSNESGIINIAQTATQATFSQIAKV